MSSLGANELRTPSPDEVAAARTSSGGWTKA